MHVLAVTPELPRPDRPGSTAPLMRQLESLQARGVELSVVDLRGIPKLKYAIAIPRMRRLLAQVDLVHAHFGFCGWLARTQIRKPLVISFMGDDLLGEPTDSGEPSWFSRQMVRANRVLATRASQVIVKSAEMADVISHVPCHIVPNGVDLNRFQPLSRADARRRLGWGQDERVVLFPGNWENPRKGFPLAEAATEIAARAIGAEIRIAHLWDVQPEDVPLYMNACDAMWMTSLLEGSPNVVKEAMACNCPIVAVPVGDVESLLDSVPGCHVCPRNPEVLGATMGRVLSSEPESGGRAAIRRMRLDLDAVADRLIKIYLQALAQNSGRKQRLQRTA